jgi:hypothetical protein
MFYYQPCQSILESTEFEIIGTYMNAWELITSNKFNAVHFPVLQKAISNFLDIPVRHEGTNPFSLMIDQKVPSNKLRQDEYEWTLMMEILESIRSAVDYESFPNKGGAAKMADHDHTARKDVAKMYSNDFTKFREEYGPQDRIKHLLGFTETLRYEATKDFNGIVKTMIERDYSRIITTSMVNWGNHNFLEEALMGFNFEYLSGARGNSKDGLSVDPNDFNDLFQMVYVDRNSFFYTEEKMWKKICIANPILKDRFIICDRNS